MCIFVDAKEVRAIQAAARKAGLSVSKYARRILVATAMGKRSDG